MARRRQGIFWILTVPHPSPVCLSISEGSLPPSVVWARGQLERGATTDYLHYQIVAAFDQKVSLTGVKSVFGIECHAELTRSSAAVDYVGKEETRVGTTFEFGCRPICRNAKPDWDSIWAAAVSGDLMLIPASIRVSSYRSLRSIGADHAVPLPMERTVHVFWGRTGTGKSRRAWDEAGLDAYSKDPRSKFWDGYQTHRHVVVDEFRGGIDVAHILRWCDRYPVRVEVKGSSRPLFAETIWFTSNVDPRNWYPELDAETLSALLRRFNITHFN